MKWSCPACGADCPPGAVLCGLCWRRCPKAHRAAIHAAWQHASAKGFGDPAAAEAYDAAVAAAARAVA